MALTNLYPGLSVGDPRATDIGASLPVLDPLRQTWWFDDFHKYTAGEWTVTETDSGATEALAAGHGGQLLITNTGADNDVTSLQLGTTSFAFAAGRRAWMAFRVKASEATDFEVFLGLAVTDTSPIASLSSEAVYFYKADDAATWAFGSRSGSASLQAASGIATLTADTFQTLQMYYDGKSTIQLYADGAKVGTLSAAFASLLPTVDMRVTIACQAGAAAAKTLTVDYGLVAMDRA